MKHTNKGATEARTTVRERTKSQASLDSAATDPHVRLG